MIRYLGAAIAGAGITLGAIVLSQSGPPTCTFDGGGTIANATFATVSTGQTFVCSNGELIEVKIVVPQP